MFYYALRFVAPIVIGLVILVFMVMIVGGTWDNRIAWPLAALALMLVLLTVLVLYLQTDRTRNVDTYAIELFGHDVRKLSYSIDEVTKRLSKVEGDVKVALSSRDLQASDRAQLVARLQQNIETAASEEFLDGMRKSLADSNVHFELKRELKQQHENTVSRLNGELRALSRRGNVNLSLGIMTAIVGMVILGTFVFTLLPADDALEFAGSFLPRISLVILVEVFAYFFLRLYSNSLIEIKYFQNEITNIESKAMALRAAAHPGNETSMKDVILKLSQTERNYVLRKGETTVDVERSKMEKETVASLLDTILNVSGSAQGSLLRKACSAEFLPEAAGRARVSGRDAAFAG